ncbi:hypothetical protein P3G55_04420 [Leptospira sp. 96542]|nr:hypothetical protein [Leptospira sp. 96542]
MNSEILNNDYADLHLGHAISLDFWLRGINESRNGYFAITHPGLLFQISSWFVYFISNLTDWFHSSGIEIAIETLQNSDRFFLISVVLSSFIICIYSIFVSLRFSFLPVIPLVGILYGITGEYTHTFIHFTNDYFSLPLILTWLYIWRLNKKNLSSIWFYVNLGILSSLIYLNKLPYIVWIFAFIITMILFFVLRQKKVIIVGLFVYIFSFCLFTFLLSCLFFDFEGFQRMVSSHKLILFNSGRMGSGSESIVSLPEVFQNFKFFLSSNNLFSTISILFSLSLILYILFVQKILNAISLKKILLSLDPLIVWGMIAFSGGFFATLKHYGYNYLLVSFAPLFLVLVALYSRRFYSLYFCLMILVTASVTFNCYFNERFFARNKIQNSELIKAKNRILDRKNLVFITEYRNPAKEFTTYHALFCSDLPQVEEIYKKVIPDTYVYYFETPRFFFGSQKMDINSLKWDYWISVYDKHGLDWYSDDRFHLLSENSVERTNVKGQYVFVYQRKK